MNYVYDNDSSGIYEHFRGDCRAVSLSSPGEDWNSAQNKVTGYFPVTEKWQFASKEQVKLEQGPYLNFTPRFAKKQTILQSFSFSCKRSGG